MGELAAEDLAAFEAEAAPQPPAAPAPIFEIELGFPPDLAPSWKALGQVAGARRRPKPVRVVWHDTPDGEFARRQLTLAEESGIWRLVALRPGKLAWPPAGLPPVISEASNYAEFELTPGFEPAPVASFIGELRAVEITAGEETITASWISGHLRGVIADVAAARVKLTGARAALRPAALALADQGGFVPLASLAAEARALAEHSVPAPRHKGAAQVPEGTNVADGLAFAIGQLVDAALYWAAKIPTASDAEPVHQMRVAVRRLRSLLGSQRRALTGPLWQSTKAILGDLARELGEAREWDVFLEGVGAELAAAWPQDRRIGLLLSQAHKRRDAAYAMLRSNLADAKMRHIAVDLALFANLRPFEAEGDESFWAMDCHDFALEALARRRRKLLAPGDDLTLLNPTELHEVRKNAKRLRYSGELFSAFWSGKAARKYLDRISELQESLGEINDAASLERLLSGLGSRGYAAGVAVGIATARAKRALKDAQAVWRKLIEAEDFWK